MDSLMSCHTTLLITKSTRISQYPPKWQQCIQDNLKCGLTKVCMSQCVELMIADLPVKPWQDILQQTRKGIAFKQKAICYHWIQEGSQLWKCADDPIESGYEWCQQFGAQENIKVIEMEPVPGAPAFSFIVKDFMNAWTQHTALFLVDLTCESS